MPLVENIPDDGKFFGLFVGRSGSGKSGAAYSFPHSEEEGILEVADLDGRFRGGLLPWINRKHFNVTPFPPKPPKGTTFEALNNYFEIMRTMIGSQNSKICTLVIDSATWMANDLLLDAIPLTHAATQFGESGRKIGTMNMAGPSDYSFQSTGILQMIAFLRSLPIKNIIVTAHVVNKYGRRKNAEGKIIDPYGPSEIIGEQLALTDKLSETLPNSFDHIFYFEKVDTGSGLRFYFDGQGELARTSFAVPYARQEFTGTSFYEKLMTFVKPKEIKK